MEIVDLLQSLSTGAMFLLTLLTFKNENGANRNANNFLGFFFLALFLLFLDDLLLTFGLYQLYPWIYGLPFSAFFLLSPLLFLSVSFFVDPRRKLKRQDGLHFLIFILFILLNSPYLFADKEDKLNYLENEIIGDEFGFSVFIILFVLQSITYGIPMIKKLRQHRKNISKYSTRGREINLNWLLILICTFLAMVFSYLFFSNGDSYVNSWHINLFFLIAVLAMARLSIFQVEVFSNRKEEREQLAELLERTADHQESLQTSFEQDSVTSIINQDSRSNEISASSRESIGEIADLETNSDRRLMSPGREIELMSLIEAEMKEEKLYLNSELNVLKLAENVMAPAYQVSHIINRKMGMNFSSYINSHRVSHSKQLLEDIASNKMNIIQIAYESGFNSKTAFNTQFKKSTGCSPTEFLKKRSIV